MKPSDFLTELSTEKLAQYKTAAAADASKADKAGDFKKGDKRFSGIVKATKKQFANDEKKVEEGVNLSPDQIQQIFQGAQNIETAGGTNRSTLGKIKDRYQSPNSNPAVTQPMATPNPGAVWRSNRNPALPAQTSPTRLSESQIHQLIEAIVKHQSQIDEGVMDWFKTKGQNLTNKITADKLLQAWKSAGSKTDSDEVAKVMVAAGVPQETVNNLMKNFVQGPSASTNTNMWQGVDRSIPAVQRKAQAAAGGATTSPAASTASGSTEMPAGWRPSNATSSGTATIPTSGTTNTATAGRVGAPAGKQAVDQAVATVKSVRGDRRPQVANYGKQQFDALAQAVAKAPVAPAAPTAKPVTAKPNNTIAMPKPGEKIKIGGQEIKPSDPLYAKLQKQMNQKRTATAESVGLPYPGTSEETNDMFKSSGQRRIGTLTTEDEQIDGMAQGEIREIIKNAIHIKNQLDKGVSLDGWMYSYVTTSNDHLNSVAEQINNPNIDEQDVAEEQLDELSCWSGYHRVSGTKAGFPGSCAKNKTNEEQEHNETCPHCGGEMVSEELMNEKKDACYYKVKSRYKVWPSAYASGALVKCRKKGADSWGNGSKNESSILEGLEQVDENLHKWFKEKWVRFGPDGKIRGDCARGDDSEGKPKCLPQSKAQNLGKKGRASAAARKRREDPNPERHGKAINVNTKKKTKG